MWCGACAALARGAGSGQGSNRVGALQGAWRATGHSSPSRRQRVPNSRQTAARRAWPAMRTATTASAGAAETTSRPMPTTAGAPSARPRHSGHAFLHSHRSVCCELWLEAGHVAGNVAGMRRSVCKGRVVGMDDHHCPFVRSINSKSSFVGDAPQCVPGVRGGDGSPLPLRAQLRRR